VLFDVAVDCFQVIKALLKFLLWGTMTASFAFGVWLCFSQQLGGSRAVPPGGNFFMIEVIAAPTSAQRSPTTSLQPTKCDRPFKKLIMLVYSTSAAVSITISQFAQPFEVVTSAIKLQFSCPMTNWVFGQGK